MATRLEKTELRIVKLTSEVEALKGKLDRQVEISKEMTEEAESARGREKVAGNKFGMLRDQLDRERNEKDAEILLQKGENEKLKPAGTDVVQRTIQTMIGKALREMRIRYEGRLDHLHQCLVDAEEADGITVPEEKIEKLLADLKDSLDLSSFQLYFGEGRHARSSCEDTPAAEDVKVPEDGEDAQGERRQGGEVDAVDASTNEELDPLFPSSKND
ncbi:hypothetical protein AALP_AA3G207200 [Arabis alpina]|uniref:Uncharacterized protein n=1 Tax=Arabis alpina TaxID=50452 RepID=A0A087HAK2_ARAAL|nr:hypothetical protein AALP_AA3G207200 [Arabis alpina]